MNAKQKRYIQWLAQTPKERDPPTEAALAEILNRRLGTLRRWQKLPGFQQALDDAIRRRLYNRKAAIYHIIGEKAEAGDVRTIKLALELMGDYPTPKGSAGGRLVDSLSIEEYMDVFRQMKTWKQEEVERLECEEQVKSDGDSKEEKQ
jgi:hypothetical protein